MSTTYELYNNGIYENGTRKGEIYGNKITFENGGGATYSTTPVTIGKWIDGTSTVKRVVVSSTTGDIQDTLSEIHATLEYTAVIGVVWCGVVEGNAHGCTEFYFDNDGITLASGDGEIVMNAIITYIVAS